MDANQAKKRGGGLFTQGCLLLIVLPFIFVPDAEVRSHAPTNYISNPFWEHPRIFLTVFLAAFLSRHR